MREDEEHTEFQQDLSEAVAFFQSLPWAASLIASARYSLRSHPARIPKANTEDAFFSQTLSTPSTIPYFITLFRQDLSTPSDRVPFTLTSSSLSLPVPSEPDAISLIYFGSPGISGHPFTAHGGLLTAVLDEVIGVIVGQHVRRRNNQGPTYTARLDTHYKKPVIVPGVYVVSAWCTGHEGRKVSARGQITDKDGVLFAEAEGLFVAFRTGSHL
ncbi:MAG: hypothetical protein Q9160_004725 [Pyrenula sp. 1 TL-2023]